MDKKRRANKMLELALQKCGVDNRCAGGMLSFNKSTVKRNYLNQPLISAVERPPDDDLFDENSGTPVYTELKPYIPILPAPVMLIPAILSDSALSSNVDLSKSIEQPLMSHATETHNDAAGISTSVLDESTISQQTEQERPSTSTSTCRRDRKAKQNKQYLDYLSEDEALLAGVFGEDTDSDVCNTDFEFSENDDNEDCTPIKALQESTDKPEEECVVGEAGVKVNPMNKRLERKKLKQSGQEYTKYNGVVVAAKKVQPNPCDGKKCGNECGSITEERRKLIFDHFWNLPTERRKDWLVSMCRKTTVKRRRAGESQKRNFTYKYFINEGEGKRTICFQFLASTLDVTEKFIYYTTSHAEFGTAQEDLRGGCEPPNKTKESTKAVVMKYIKSLPAMPSHYCRKDSSRVYLPQELKNLSNLYKIYKKNYIEQGVDVVSERVFRNIFHDNFNIGFHVPKKDKCLKCLKFQGSTEDNPSLIKEKMEHETEKVHTYSRFKAHQNIHKTYPNTLCVSFDLQKVLNTPHGESMLLYYSRKLAVYNLCFYESGTRKVFCFYWNEVNGKRGANEIATILNKYINIVDERGTVKNLLLYCDCCPGQNRNRVILAMIHSTLQICNNIETIQINFLLTGHTYMPVDSVHAVIEKNVKNCIIYAPSQWYTVFSTARQESMPYNVELMIHSAFLRWNVISEKYFKGNLTGKISKIRVATFKKKDDSQIVVKYSMNESMESFPIDVQSKAKIAPTVCYKSLLFISKTKYDDLYKLCKDKVIPEAFHQEYLTIPTAANVRDTLPDTDVEDDDSE